MRDDFKNRRRGLTTVQAINEAKEKFGSKRSQSEMTLSNDTEAVKRRKSQVNFQLLILSSSISQSKLLIK